jgi:AICAR transformylase/IMP cyclohydrolase PurH
VTRGARLPLTVLNGSPGYINILDALTAWQLVRELTAVTGKEAAASFKHVSPAGAAVAGPITDAFAQSQFLDVPPESAVACAYVRARGADRMSSFGDAAAVSGRVNLELAEVLKSEVSDLVIAPSYDEDALRLLKTKRRGQYLILQIDPDYEPDAVESRDVFGLTLEQERNAQLITPELFAAADPLPPAELESLIVATTALKYTQSNSACVAYRGQVIGLGAGQQSRIHCTRLACSKAEKWMLQTHPKVLSLRFPPGMGRPERTNAIDQYILWAELSRAEQAHFIATVGYEPEPLSLADKHSWFSRFEGLVMSSDAFIPFRDNVDRAAMTGVSYVAHAGGSIRDDSVRQAAAEAGVTVIETGVRCFLH